MTNTKLSELPTITSISSEDLLYVVDDPAGTPTSSKITFSNFQNSLTSVNSAITSGLALITSGTLASRQIVAGSAKIAVTNGSGVAGNPSIDLGSVSLADLTDGASLASIAALTSGVVAITGVGTAAGRTITGTANEITVTNGDGVSGNPTLSLASGIDATKIGAGTVSSTEFGYLDGVTSAIQTQINAKQTTDATLTALAAYNTNGLLTQTAADTFTGRTITGTANQITVTNGDGVAGNPTLSLDATLAALGTYNTNGLLTQTAADTFTGRTITGTNNQIDVTDGNGVSGNPTIGLSDNLLLGTIGATKDGGGVALSTGKIGGYITCPYTASITAWSIGVDTGTATVKVWKVATGTAVPTAANSINTSGVSISSGTYIRSATLTDFTDTTVTANNILAFNIEAVSGATQITFALELTKP